MNSIFNVEPAAERAQKFGALTFGLNFHNHALSVQYRYPDFPMGASAGDCYEMFFDEEYKTVARSPKSSKFRDADFKIDEKARKRVFCEILEKETMTRGRNASLLSKNLKPTRTVADVLKSVERAAARRKRVRAKHAVEVAARVPGEGYEPCIVSFIDVLGFRDLLADRHAPDIRDVLLQLRDFTAPNEVNGPRRMKEARLISRAFADSVSDAEVRVRVFDTQFQRRRVFPRTPRPAACPGAVPWQRGRHSWWRRHRGRSRRTSRQGASVRPGHGSRL